MVAAAIAVQMAAMIAVIFTFAIPVSVRWHARCAQ
jgi:hypothetical protein